MRQEERTHLSVALQCVVNVADSTHDPITALLGRSIVVDTPATQTGSSYALLPARLLCLPGGPFLVLAVLLSQRRTNGTFLRPLTFGELAPFPGFLREDARGTRCQSASSWPCPPCGAQADG